MDGAKQYRPKDEELEHTIESVEEDRVEEPVVKKSVGSVDVICMVLGIVSVVMSLVFGFIGAFVSVVCGIVALTFHRKARKSGMKNGKLVAGLACSWVGIGISIVKSVITVIALTGTIWLVTHMGDIASTQYQQYADVSSTPSAWSVNGLLDAAAGSWS